jgi:glutaredoxin-related protein
MKLLRSVKECAKLDIIRNENIRKELHTYSVKVKWLSIRRNG